MDCLPPHIQLRQEPWQPHRQSAVMSMGLKRIDADAWLLREGLALQAYRDNKIQQTTLLGDRVLQLMPQAFDAADELSSLIESELQLGESSEDSSLDRFYQNSLAVAEDLCILQAGDSGYKLVGAHLCAPSHWLMEEKMGRDMDPIHAPVPGYQPNLARSVNRFLDKLGEGRLVERFNWSLDDTPQLCQRPTGRAPTEGRVLRYYRVERQTLRRLPRTGAIVFSILVRQWPLWYLNQFEGARVALEVAVDELPELLKKYKSFTLGARMQWRVTP
ncbi:MAG: heme-dependent oxidative N-demethylase family protein [Granulosicoccaceae bacterium]